MKIWIFSDLHIEINGPTFLPIPEGAQVAILAGDIDRPIVDAVDWINSEIAWRMPVIYVPGNHEFYRDSVEGGLQRGLEAAATSPYEVHVLHDSSVVIDSVRFVGGTLWTDYALGAEGLTDEGRDRDIAYAMRNASGMLNDHKVIKRVDRREAEERQVWMPVDARQAHHRTRAYLESVLATPFDGPTVVVTHHAPSPLSVAPRFKGSPLNPAFASDLTDLIWQHQPDVWIHGHVHDSFDYELGATRVIANPRGYGAENPAFDPSLVVEIAE